jgi:CRP-like cAMP-binding protein
MIETLQVLPLFKDANPGVLAMLAEKSHIRTVEKEEIIFLQDEEADAVYFVVKGSVAIVLTSYAGRELVINTMHPGDCFGELGVLAHTAHTADAIAREHSQLLVIPSQAFLQGLETEPQLTRHLLSLVVQRLCTSSERESALAFLNAHARLGRVLLDLDKQSNTLGYITIGQEELAQYSGLTRQTVAKLLGQWRRSGWLLTGRGRIMLLNRPAIRRIVQEGIV